MQKHANIVEWFSINKSQVKVIFVDETLIHSDRWSGFYWLWIGYEPNMDLCLMMFVLYLHVGMNRIRFMKFILVDGG
jgi:hypothetical protein